jgi:hypothetical protein
MDERPRRHDDEERNAGSSSQAREDLFGQVLGEQWETAGDGIYRLTASGAPTLAEPADELEDVPGPSRSLAEDGGDSELPMSKRRGLLRRRR